MKLEGTYTFDAPRDVVWQALLDPEILAKVMPGCEGLEKVGEDEYKAALKIKVGPVQGKFEGGIKLTEINAPDSYNMEVDGKGPAGFMKGHGKIWLEDQGSSTLMHYGGEAQVGGRIASVGQRLLDSSAKALTRQSLDGLNKQIRARLQGDNNEVRHSDAGAAPEAAPEIETQPMKATSAPAPVQQEQPQEVKAPSEIEFALGVGKHMIEDLLPPERRPLLIGAALGVLAFVLFLNWWSGLIARKIANEIWERR
jgi:carbon monoxide dehydrogenase subunit G